MTLLGVLFDGLAICSCLSSELHAHPGSSRALHPTSPSFQASHHAGEHFQSTLPATTKKQMKKHPRTTNNSNNKNQFWSTFWSGEYLSKLILQ